MNTMNAKKNRILFLSAQDVRQVLTMHDCIDTMQDAFAELASGRAVVPLRSTLAMPDENGRALFMPVYLPNIQKVGLKSVTIHQDNAGKGLPLIHAMVMVFDASTGEPLAVMDGEVITAMRTGAVSGLATKYLARANAEIAAIFGAGVQGETQLEAVCAVRAIKKAYIFNRNAERKAAFIKKMQAKLGIEIIAAESMHVLSQADIICAATTSTTPVFKDAEIGAGVHINGVGSYRPDMCEIPPETMGRAKIVVDQMGACLSEAGDILQPIEQGLFAKEYVYGELGEVVTGMKVARAGEDEITVFKSVGLAVQDLATADLVLTQARKLGLGSEVAL